MLSRAQLDEAAQRYGFRVPLSDAAAHALQECLAQPVHEALAAAMLYADKRDGQRVITTEALQQSARNQVRVWIWQDDGSGPDGGGPDGRRSDGGTK